MNATFPTLPRRRPSKSGLRPKQPRTDRRQEILDAALALFAERGYDGTGIEDIGRAVNITGPAIYRHFASKEEILVTAFANAGREMIEGFERSQDRPPAEALDILLLSHASMAVRQAPWIHLWMRERHRLPRRWADSTRNIQKSYLSWFATVVGELHPTLDAAQRAETVNAVIGLLNGAGQYRSGMPDELRIAFLVSSARAVVKNAGAKRRA